MQISTHNKISSKKQEGIMNNSFILAAYKSQLANFIQDSAAANVSQLVPSKVLTCNRTRAVARQPVPHLQKKCF